MDDSDEVQESLTTIPEEQATRQELVPFLGDDLAAAMTPKGAIYVTFPGMCSALGLDVKSQIRRIRRTKALDSGMRLIALATRGGVQRVNCLRVDKVALWLAGVQTAQVKADYRPKIEMYQEELAPLATQVFMRVMGIQSTPAPVGDGRITAMLDQFDTLISVALDVREHMRALNVLPEQIDAMRWQLDQAMELLESIAGDNAETHEAIAQIKVKTAGLTPAQARQVQEQIGHMVTVTEGMPGELKHATIYGRIRHRFRVPSYNKVPDTRFEDLLQFLRDELQRATDGETHEQGSLF